MLDDTCPQSPAAYPTESLPIPGPRGTWLLGSLSELRAGMLAFYERCQRDYGPVCSFRLGYRRMVMVNEPALIEDVLVTHNKCFKKHYASQLLKPMLGKGLILSEGDFWLKQRRLIRSGPLADAPLVQVGNEVWFETSDGQIRSMIECRAMHPGFDPSPTGP